MHGNIKNRVLFVDDEQFVLLMLQGFMRRMRDGWDGEFAGGGHKALELMDKNPFDIIVSDMRMPEMSGAELLNQVMKRHPRTARIVLSGHAEEHLVLESIGVTHQWLVKPCELTILRSTLERISAFQRRLESPELKALIGQIKHLPSVPVIYHKILDALQDPNSSTQMIGEMVSQDPGLAAKLLQLTNSAFFGFARSVSSPVEAVQMLGVNRIRSLTLINHVCSAFEGETGLNSPMEELWQHSLHTAWLARQIVEIENGGANAAEQAFTSGLLHDIGHLMLLANLPEQCREVRELARSRKCPLYLAEKEVLKATHADVGAYLLSLWGLPLPLVEAVAFHHEPAQSSERDFSPLVAVHVANIWSRAQLASSPDIGATAIDLDYLKETGLHERLSIWQQQLLAD